VILGSIFMLLVLAPSADAKVRKVSLTETAKVGQQVRFVVDVTPRSRCSISVKGLAPRTGGRITWTWRIAKDATPGQTLIRVNCGKAGNYATSIRIPVDNSSAKLLPAAKLAVCNQAAARVRQKYGLELTRGEDFFAGRTDAAAIVAKINTEQKSDCFFAAPKGLVDDALWYLINVSLGGQGCSFTVTTRLYAPNTDRFATPRLPAETYVEQCSALGLR
jgi:hypothetical protein